MFMWCRELLLKIYSYQGLFLKGASTQDLSPRHGFSLEVCTMLLRFTIGVQDSGLRAAGFRFQCVLGLEFVRYRVEVRGGRCRA